MGHTISTFSLGTKRDRTNHLIVDWFEDSRDSGDEILTFQQSHSDQHAFTVASATTEQRVQVLTLLHQFSSLRVVTRSVITW